MTRTTRIKFRAAIVGMLVVICSVSVVVALLYLGKCAMIEALEEQGQQEYWTLDDVVKNDDTIPVEEKLQEVQPEEPTEILPEYKDFASEYPNFAGWLTIPDTDFSYPVMLAPESDPNYYLYHTYSGDYNTIGCPYIPYYGNYNSDNVIIYGHHIKNHRVFGFLDYYRDEDFYNNNRFLYFDTPYQHRIYEIVSVMIVSVDDPVFHFQSYIDWNTLGQSHFYNQQCYDRNIHGSDTMPEDGAKLLTLVTCEYSIPNGKGRLVIVARDVTYYGPISESN